MRRGWLALLISLTLHAVVIAALCRLPGVHVDQAAAAFIVQDRDFEPGVMTFLVEDHTDVIKVDKPPSSVPAETPAKVVPKIAPPATGKPSLSARGQGNERPAKLEGTNAPTEKGSGSGVSTTFFQVPAVGRKIVYLLDASASMGLHGALAAAARELSASVRRLPASARFQVIVYNRTAQPLLPALPHWLSPSADNLQSVERALEGLRAEGGTNHLDAVRRALLDGPEVVYFLTDAGTVRNDLPRQIGALNHGHAIIHVIELRSGEGAAEESPLRALARANRGVFQPVQLVN